MADDDDDDDGHRRFLDRNSKFDNRYRTAPARSSAGSSSGGGGRNYERGDDDGDEQGGRAKGARGGAADEDSRVGKLQREAHLMWGVEKKAAMLGMFRQVRYEFEMNGVTKEMKQFFAHPGSDQYQNVRRGTLRVPFEDHTENLSFMLKQDDEREIDKAMLTSVKEMANAEDGFYGHVKTGNVLIQRLDVTTFDCPINHSLEIGIKGMGDKYTVPHCVSWDKEAKLLATLNRNTPRRTIYNFNSLSTDLPVFHGIHDIEQDNLRGVSAWGNVNGRIVDVYMPTGRFVWFMTNLVSLIHAFVTEESKEKKLPEGVDETIWDAIIAWHDENKPPNIYDPNERLDDNYIGKLMCQINPDLNPENRANDTTAKTRRILWSVADDKLVYRVPLAFMQFVINQYMDVVRIIRMIVPAETSMTSKPSSYRPVRPFDPDTDFLEFEAEVSIFPPGMFFAVSNVEENEES